MPKLTDSKLCACVSHRDTPGHSNGNRRSPLCFLFPFQAVSLPPPPLPTPPLPKHTHTHIHTPSQGAGFCPYSPSAHRAVTKRPADGKMCVCTERSQNSTHIIWHTRSTCVCTLYPATAPYLYPLPLLPISTRDAIWGSRGVTVTEHRQLYKSNYHSQMYILAHCLWRI